MSEKTIINKIFVRSRIAARKVPWINRIILSKQLRQRFPHEFCLLDGVDESKTNLPSVLHFSINKAATQYVKSILFRLAKENELVPIGLHDLAFHSRLPYMTSLRDGDVHQFQRLFRPNGYIYSAFNGTIPWVKDLKSYCIIVVIRDPRDILTSKFFSKAFSHTVPDASPTRRDKFLEMRKQALVAGIDSNVYDRLPACVETFRQFIRLVDESGSNQNISVLKYESMVEDFPGWVDSVAAACGLEMTDTLKSALLQESEVIRTTLNNQEDPHSHLRKGRPGDFREKLMPETIEHLNRELAFVLEYFGYPVE